MENIIEDAWGAEYANGIIPFFHKDSNGNIVSKEVTGGTYTIKNGVIVLEEYPDLQYGLTISLLNEDGTKSETLSRVEKSYSALNENEYIVDIVTGFIHFHSSLEGSQVKVDDYFGKGQWLITDKRIIADIGKDSNGNYDYKTLAETIASAKGFISKGDWDRETAYDMNNIVVHNGVIYISKQTDEKNKGKEPGKEPSKDYWDVVIDVNSIVSTVQSQLNLHTSNKNNPHSVTKAQVGLGNVDNTSDLNKPISTAMQKELDKKADKQNSYGGFAGGNSANTTSGGAIGENAESTEGFAGGREATTTGGGAVGDYATATEGGGAVGSSAFAISGGAVGCDTGTEDGGAVGYEAASANGGAVGCEAKAGDGFSGGNLAKVSSFYSDGKTKFIDAIQLGTGTNSSEKTLQVYDYTLMNADGTIPSERVNNVTLSKEQVGLGNVENKSSATIRSEITKENVTTALGYTPPSSDTDTHYTSKNVVGNSSGTSDATSVVTNGNVYLKHVDGGAMTSRHKISGAGATTVTTDTNANIIITSTDTVRSSYTLIFAASNSSNEDKARADVVLSGSNDRAEIKNAVSALSSTSGKRATLYFCEGTYNLKITNTWNGRYSGIDLGNNIAKLSGAGYGTIFNINNSVTTSSIMYGIYAIENVIVENVRVIANATDGSNTINLLYLSGNSQGRNIYLDGSAGSNSCRMFYLENSILKDSFMDTENACGISLNTDCIVSNMSCLDNLKCTNDNSNQFLTISGSYSKVINCHNLYITASSNTSRNVFTGNTSSTISNSGTTNVVANNT